jgi:hypothetical protein
MSKYRAFAGIDWASMVHVACVVGPDGEVVDRFEFPHDAAAITGMIQRLKRSRASGVAIERGDGPVVEALMDSVPPFIGREGRSFPLWREQPCVSRSSLDLV